MCKAWFEEVKWKICVCKLTLPYIDGTIFWWCQTYPCADESWEWIELSIFSINWQQTTGVNKVITHDDDDDDDDNDDDNTIYIYMDPQKRLYQNSVRYRKFCTGLGRIFRLKPEILCDQHSCYRKWQFMTSSQILIILHSVGSINL